MYAKNIYPSIYAILAAILFGISTPLSKLMLDQMDSIVLASFLYLGSGLGVIVLLMIQKILLSSKSIEAGIHRKDIPWLIGAILAGGVAAPIILLIGLKNSSAATASLLLNFEGVATTIIAFLFFKEAIGKGTFAAVVLITLASILLTWNSTGDWTISAGALGILGACVLWGLDNNFIRNISEKDPLVIVAIKGLAAGLFSVVLACLFGKKIPGLDQILPAMLIGFVCYGLSISLFILAMRHLGSARTSVLFGIAPFVGALTSIFIFNDVPNLLFWFSIPIMLVGAGFMLFENHQHNHLHQSLVHEHAHSHPEDHHQHLHGGDDQYVGIHAHSHEHEVLIHSHAHTPDQHHRHPH